MTDAGLILGQDADQTTMSTVYTVPASTYTIVSTIYVCNRTGSSIAVRVALIKSGDTVDEENYIYYDVPVPANETLASKTGASLATGDFVQWQGGSAGLSITVCGIEVT